MQKCIFCFTRTEANPVQAEFKFVGCDKCDKLKVYFCDQAETESDHVNFDPNNERLITHDNDSRVKLSETERIHSK